MQSRWRCLLNRLRELDVKKCEYADIIRSHAGLNVSCLISVIVGPVLVVLLLPALIAAAIYCSRRR